MNGIIATSIVIKNKKLYILKSIFFSKIIDELENLYAKPTDIYNIHIKINSAQYI
jgi:hypothetical protein